MTEKQQTVEPEPTAAEEGDAELACVLLTQFNYTHQIHVPWGSTPSAGFQVGAGGVVSIEVTAAGAVVVTAQKATDIYELWFAGGGYGWRKLEPEFACDDCGELFPVEVERDAHKRSHKPNHKGSGK